MSPSPDGSGILFIAFLARKRYSGQQETAPNSAPESSGCSVAQLLNFNKYTYEKYFYNFGFIALICEL